MKDRICFDDILGFLMGQKAEYLSAYSAMPTDNNPVETIVKVQLLKAQAAITTDKYKLEMIKELSQWIIEMMDKINTKIDNVKITNAIDDVDDFTPEKKGMLQ